MLKRWFFVPAGVVVLALSACGSAGSEEEFSAPVRVQFEDGMTASVVTVDSGNTFIADFGGVRKSVRLVNTAAPSENGVAMSQDCLVEESQAALAERLPEGTEVTLNFDENTRGGTGYVEAAVYVGESFINWDMARAGMVATTFATAQDKFYADISGAQQEAAHEGVGLYSRDVECTIPAAIARERAAVEDARSWDVPEEDTARAAERESVYQHASSVHNEFVNAQSAPSQWLGSVVTLDAVSGQLAELRDLLGGDLYSSNGLSLNQQRELESEEPESVRPGQ